MDAVLIATGSVGTTARLGSSKDDDSMDVNYSSDFRAEFSYDYDKHENSFSFELENLGLDLEEWERYEPDEFEDEDIEPIIKTLKPEDLTWVKNLENQINPKDVITESDLNKLAKELE